MIFTLNPLIAFALGSKYILLQMLDVNVCFVAVLNRVQFQFEL